MPKPVSSEFLVLPDGVLAASRGLQASVRRQEFAMGGGRGGGTARGDGWTRTAADDQLLAGATRFGVLTVRQAARRYWNGSGETARQRVRWLRQAGYVRTSADTRWAGSCVWTTARGVRAAGVDLRAPEWPGERLLHRLAVADAAITFELGGARTLAEREVRRAEATSRARAEQVALGLSPTAGFVTDGEGRDRFLCVPVGAKGRVHYPDLLVASPAGLAAVEVEISEKAPVELRRVLRAYRDAGAVFGQVVYFATEPVMALVHGYAHPQTGVWTDGVAQQVGLLPSGPPRYRADSAFMVRHFQPKDPGVAYQLDLRQLPEAWRVDFGRWKQLRARWEKERSEGLGFLAWWLRQRP